MRTRGQRPRAAKALGKNGGTARAAKMTPERRNARSDCRGAADGERVEAEVTHRLGALSLPRDRHRHQGRIHRLAPEAAMIRIANTGAAYHAICSTLPEDAPLWPVRRSGWRMPHPTSKRPSSTVLKLRATKC